MKEIKVCLNSIADVKKFVNMVSMFDCDIDLVSERYIVDAKSIMGIFSLDLSKPIKVEVYSDDTEEFTKEMQEFIVE